MVVSLEARDNSAGADGRPPTSSIFSPFPAWKQPADEHNTREEQLPAHRQRRTLRHSPSAVSSVHSATPPPERPKRFNLRDGVQRAIKCIRKRDDAKQMTVSKALYGFYSSEISLHFLHALSAYFICVAKDSLANRTTQQAPGEDGSDGTRFLPSGEANAPDCAAERQGRGLGEGRAGSQGGDGGIESDVNAGAQERATLLREVGRSYGRVVVYCSNFERTSADALFFESLLCLARMVVSAAVAEPSLAPEVDKEFDRVLRGDVFHPSPLRPMARPVRRRSLPTNAPSSTWGDGFTRYNFSGHNGSCNGQRGVVSGTYSTTVSSASPRDNIKGVLNGGGGRGGPGSRLSHTEKGKDRRKLRRESAIRRGKDGSRRPHHYPPKHLDGGSSPFPPASSARKGAGPKQSFNSMVGGKARQLRDAKGEEGGGAVAGRVEGQGGELDEDTRAPEQSPGFDELSRWRVSRGSVPTMVGLAGRVQRIALSNLALAESYRRALASKFSKGAAATDTSTPKPTPRPDGTLVSAAANGNKRSFQQQQQQQQTLRKGVGKEAVGSRPLPSVVSDGSVSCKRKGRVLTSRRRQNGCARAPDSAKKEFFNADELSVCIAAVVEK